MPAIINYSSSSHDNIYDDDKNYNNSVSYFIYEETKKYSYY